VLEVHRVTFGSKQAMLMPELFPFNWALSPSKALGMQIYCVEFNGLEAQHILCESSQSELEVHDVSLGIIPLAAER
jgi:hypothetical protein